MSARTPDPSSDPLSSPPKYFAHETAIVDAPCSIGAGTKIWHFSHVQQGAQIGRDCSFGQNVLVGPGVVVGDGVRVQNNVSIYAGVTLEDFVFVGPSAVFTNILTPRCEFPRKETLVPTRVRRGASLGANCTIVCGTTVGRYALVGAGAVVTRDVPDHALVVGTPARVVGWACACGLRLQAVRSAVRDHTTGGTTGGTSGGTSGEAPDFACRACGRTYRKAAAGLAPIEPAPAAPIESSGEIESAAQIEQSTKIE